MTNDIYGQPTNEQAELALTPSIESQLRRAGWKQGRSRYLTARPGPRCDLRHHDRRCVQHRDHLTESIPLPHIVVFAPSREDSWYLEFWGNG